LEFEINLAEMIENLNISIHPQLNQEHAVDFCSQFLSGDYPRFIFGRNEYAQSIAQEISVDGFIDDFTSESEFFGKPIFKAENLPRNSRTVVAVVGRPFTARQKLDAHGLINLDYFAFRKYSNLNILGVWDWDLFEADFKANQLCYESIHAKFEDDVSREILNKLINFRLSSDLRCMDGFTDIQARQYFEDFLELKTAGESFVDVGCFDGYTSLEFVKRCPDYKNIFVFEPDPKNMGNVKSKLAHLKNIQFFQLGLSDKNQTFRFSSNAQASRFNPTGDLEVEVAPFCEKVNDPISFLKMDIEGAELEAIRGARLAIEKHHPKLAISVYHRCSDVWKIPTEILSYRSDYKIYLRHYIEGISETIMYFVPC